MRVVGVDQLEAFKQQHPDAAGALDTWLEFAHAATWLMPSDVTAALPKTSGLSECRFVFNIRGNHYRLLARISFKNQLVKILCVGTHEEYDAWDL